MSTAPAALLDRDGTLIVERHYLSDPEAVELLPGAALGLARLRGLGYKLLVVTNQSGLARGYFDQARLDAIHTRMRELLAAEGVELDGIYVCPHLPEHACTCRKPMTGLALQAAAEHGFSPERSIVVGDKPCDIDLGRAIGARTFLVRTGYGARYADSTCADAIANDLSEVAERIATQVGHR